MKKTATEKYIEQIDKSFEKVDDEVRELTSNFTYVNKQNAVVEILDLLDVLNNYPEDTVMTKVIGALREINRESESESEEE
jgi:hypothetical protein